MGRSVARDLLGDRAQAAATTQERQPQQAHADDEHMRRQRFVRGHDAALAGDAPLRHFVGENLAARLPGRHELAEGTSVRLGWREEDSHWFEAASGLRRSDIADSVSVPA